MKTNLEYRGIGCELHHATTRENLAEALQQREFDLFVCGAADRHFTERESMALVRELRPEAPVILLPKLESASVDPSARTGEPPDLVMRSIRRFIELLSEGNLRRQTERALRKTKSRYSALLQATPDCVVRIDGSGCVISLNASAEAAFGFSSKDLLGKPLSPIIAKDGKIDFNRLKPNVWHAEELKRSDGTLFPVEVLRVSENRSDQRISLVIRDVSNQKLQEESLRVAEEKYRSIFEHAQEGIFQTSADGSYLTVNPALVSMYGYQTADEMIGSLTDIGAQLYVDPGQREKLNARLAEHGRVRGYESRIRRADGTLIWISENIRIVRDEQGKLLYYEGTVLDITERKELENRLLQSQKMEAVGHLAGGIAHDFNNVLSIILGNVELVRAQEYLSDSSRESIDAIQQASQRAADLVRQILTFSRKEDPKRKPLQLHTVVKEAAKLMRTTLPATVEVRQDLDRVSTVLADLSQIHQIIINLCTNAWHAVAPESGVITLDLLEVEADDTLRAEMPELVADRYVCLNVKDNGCGMDADTLSHIFTPFFTTKPPGHGTGLGLAVVHGIVKSHEGALQVRSQPGLGTSFSLYFPTVEMAEEKEETKITNAQGSGQRILLVDDEPALVAMGQRVFRRLGYEVTGLTSPIEALAEVKSAPCRFDLIVTDFNMPGMSGGTLASRLHEIKPDLPIVLVTGYADGISLESKQAAVFRKIIDKPYRIKNLGNDIREALQPIE